MARTKRRNLAALNARQQDEQPVQMEDKEQLDEEDWEGLENDLETSADHEVEEEDNKFEEVMIEQRIRFLIPPLPPRKRREAARRERFREELAAAESTEKVSPAKTRKIVDVMEAPRPAFRPAAPPSPPPARPGIQPCGTNAINTKLRFIKKKLKRSGGLSLWLVSKGLAKLAPVFQKNKIQEEDLLNLSIDTLKRLGVDRVGPRRKLISAIQQLSNIV